MSDNDAPIDPLLHDMEPELDEATDDEHRDEDPTPRQADLPDRPPEAPDGPTQPEPIT